MVAFPVKMALPDHLAWNQETSAYWTSIRTFISSPACTVLKSDGLIVTATISGSFTCRMDGLRISRTAVSTSSDYLVVAKVAIRQPSREALVSDCLTITTLENSIEPNPMAKMNGATSAISTQVAALRLNRLLPIKKRLLGRPMTLPILDAKNIV